MGVTVATTPLNKGVIVATAPPDKGVIVAAVVEVAAGSVVGCEVATAVSVAVRDAVAVHVAVRDAVAVRVAVRDAVAVAVGVGVGNNAKVAVTTLLASIITAVGFVLPVAAPLQALNCQFGEAFAVNKTTVPEMYTGRFGFFVTVPLPTMFTVKVNVTGGGCAIQDTPGPNTFTGGASNEALAVAVATNAAARINKTIAKQSKHRVGQFIWILQRRATQEL